MEQFLSNTIKGKVECDHPTQRTITTIFCYQTVSKFKLNMDNKKQDEKSYTHTLGFSKTIVDGK